MEDEEQKLIQEAQLLALRVLHERLHVAKKWKCETVFVGSNELRAILQEGGKPFDWVEAATVYKIHKGKITKINTEEEMP